MGCSGGSCSTCTECDGDDCDLPPGMLSRYSLDQSTAAGVLVWLEIEREDNGKQTVSECSYDVLSKICSSNDGRTFAVLFGGPELKALYPHIFGFGVGTIYHVRDKGCDIFDPDAYSKIICDVSERIVPAAIVLPGSEHGNQLGCRISAMTSGEFRRNCIAVRMSGNVLETEPLLLEDSMMCNRIRFPRVASLMANTSPHYVLKDGDGTAIYWQSR